MIELLQIILSFLGLLVLATILYQLCWTITRIAVKVYDYVRAITWEVKD